MNAFAMGHVVVVGPDDGSPSRAPPVIATQANEGGSNPDHAEPRRDRGCWSRSEAIMNAWDGIRRSVPESRQPCY
jgi:hypothetical protein